MKILIQILRVVGVWLITLSIFSFLYGGDAKGFSFVFSMYGFFMTLPALVILTIVVMIEAMLIQFFRRSVVLALGPLMALLVPALLFLLAPNKSNAIMGLYLVVPMTLGAGILWAISFLMIPTKKRPD